MSQTELSGHLGHLSQEQELKLKALWYKVATATQMLSKEEADKLVATMTEGEKGSEKKGSLGSNWGADALSSVPGNISLDPATLRLTPEESSWEPATLRKCLWTSAKLEHPDTLLLRYLRYQDWAVSAAFKSISSSLRWREEANIEKLMAEGEAKELADSLQNGDPQLKKEGDGFMHQLRQGRSFYHQTDLGGRNVNHLIMRNRVESLEEQSAKFLQKATSALQKFTNFNCETGRMLLKPPVEAGTLLIDFTDFGLRNLDYEPIRYLVNCVGDHYPESLHTAILYNAPMSVGDVRSTFQNWFKPIVTGDVHFANGVQELEKFIEKKRIMQELGGDEDFEYEYIEPKEGENDRMKDVAAREKLETERRDLYAQFETITKQWISGEGQQGSDDIKKQRDDVARKLCINYCRLDPYIRARSIYDRLGMIDLEAVAKEEEAALG